MSKQFHFKQFSSTQEHSLVLFDPKIGPYLVLALMARVDPREWAMKELLRIPPNSSITEAWTSDCFVSYPRHSFGESYSSIEKQSVNFAAPADWSRDILKRSAYENECKLCGKEDLQLAIVNVSHINFWIFWDVILFRFNWSFFGWNEKIYHLINISLCSLLLYIYFYWITMTRKSGKHLHGTLKSCFDLIRSHHQCMPWSPPLVV